MTTFQPFPRLPFELRARIWALTVEPRTVDISASVHYLDAGKALPVSSTPVPAPLQACQESRKELQKYYQRAFSELRGSHGAWSRYVWTNLDLDIISIGNGCYHDAYEPIAPLIQRLQFEGEISNSRFDFSCIDSLLRVFINAREIYVVCKDGLSAWYGALEDLYWPCGEGNVWMIDLEDNGRMMKATEVDQIMHREFKEAHAHDGFDYDIGLPLEGEELERARKNCANHACRWCCECVPPCPQSLWLDLLR